MRISRVVGAQIAALTLIAGFGLTGCSSAEFGNSNFSRPTVREPVEDFEPSEAEKNASMHEAETKFDDWLATQVGWVCSYEPTINDDWHDDVLCHKGKDSDRPYLREWDGFVTYDELMESAREYEATLNAGR